MNSRTRADSSKGRKSTEAIREQIRLAALHCFVEKGYHGTTIRDIADQAQFSVSGMYHYYDSKMAMLEEVMHDAVDDLVAQLEESLKLSDPDPLSKFKALVETLTRYHCERPQEGFLGNAELRSLPSTSLRRLIRKRYRGQDWIEQVIKEGVEAGVFDVSDPHESARAVASLCSSVVVWFHDEGRSSPRDMAAIYCDFSLDLVRFVR